MRLQLSYKAANDGGGGDITKGEAGANLKKLLVLKADNIDLQRVFELKANKVDLENMLDV